jgi:hypothetical protein
LGNGGTKENVRRSKQKELLFIAHIIEK